MRNLFTRIDTVTCVKCCKDVCSIPFPVQVKMGILQFKMGIVHFKMGIVQFNMGIVNLKMEKLL